MGALVRGVEPGLPAEKAGLEAGDIIVKVDGKTVEKSGDLPRIVGAAKPGSKINLQIFRRGAYKDVAVSVTEIDPDKTASAASPAKTALGLAVQDLTEAQKRELRLKGGVRIENAKGAAARAGLKEGDIILSVDNQEIADAKQFAAVAAKLDKARRATFLVRRGEWVNYVVVEIAR